MYTLVITNGSQLSLNKIVIIIKLVAISYTECAEVVIMHSIITISYIYQ